MYVHIYNTLTETQTHTHTHTHTHTQTFYTTKVYTTPIWAALMGCSYTSIYCAGIILGIVQQGWVELTGVLYLSASCQTTAIV